MLAPTRELALQVAEAIGKYAHYLPGLHVLPIYGGQATACSWRACAAARTWSSARPGRVIDHLEKKTLDLTALRFLVLDEADEMLQHGLRRGRRDDPGRHPGRQAGRAVLGHHAVADPPDRQAVPDRCRRDHRQVDQTVTAANTRQRYLQVANPQKLDALTRILEVEPFEAMIVFVRTKQATEDLAERLRARGFSAAAINGDLVQAQRERTIGQLKSGALDILVATDVAARGLDVERISHVVNYDIPTDTESYVHRIGRTGRAGRTGEALLFVTPRERHLLAAIERATRQPLDGDAAAHGRGRQLAPGWPSSPTRSPPAWPRRSWRCSAG